MLHWSKPDTDLYIFPHEMHLKAAGEKGPRAGVPGGGVESSFQRPWLEVGEPPSPDVQGPKGGAESQLWVSEEKTLLCERGFVSRCRFPFHR